MLLRFISLIFAGLVSLVFGLLFLFSPETVRNLSEKANIRIVNVDEKVYNLRMGIGICLILIFCLTFFTIYYLVKVG